jgi:hypothetical protein
VVGRAKSQELGQCRCAARAGMALAMHAHGHRCVHSDRLRREAAAPGCHSRVCGAHDCHPQDLP